MLREQRMRWDHDEKMLQAEVADWKDRYDKKGRELVEEGSACVSLSLSPLSLFLSLSTC